MSILLFFGMAAFASSIPQALHELDHQREDQARAQAERKSSHPTPPHHSEDECPICRQFHAPMTSYTPHAWLIDAGAWVPFVSMLAIHQQSQTFPSRIACRGPPRFVG